MVTNALRITYSFIWRKRQKYETLTVFGRDRHQTRPFRQRLRVDFGKTELRETEGLCSQDGHLARPLSNGLALEWILVSLVWFGRPKVHSRQASRSRRKPPLGQANFGREPLSYSPVACISRTPYRKPRIAGSSQISSRAKWAKCESRCVLLRCWPRIKTQNQRRSNRSNIKGRDRATIQSQPN